MGRNQWARTKGHACERSLSRLVEHRCPDAIETPDVWEGFLRCAASSPSKAFAGLGRRQAPPQGPTIEPQDASEGNA
eukprot:9266577-Pyramimonas_sp.AAC.1